MDGTEVKSEVAIVEEVAAPACPYTAPDWARPADADLGFGLDVLRGGVDMGRVALGGGGGESFAVVGRLPSCHVRLEHPSVSRFHAVLQFGRENAAKTDGSADGWHLYDLGSTHGSWVNKQRAPPKQFIRLHVGHVLRFGGSTRLFILHGPEADMEPESPLTVTEIKRQNERRQLIADGILEPDKKDESDSAAYASDGSEDGAKPKDVAETGISWGFDDAGYAAAAASQDADEEAGEEIDFETLQQRENYYRDDPKTVLRKFFAREGHELKFEIGEKGNSFRHQWSCRVELPVETPTGQSLVAEVSVSGSKREAQVQCALEACRILDANGVLRRGQSESKRRQLTNLAENDFYESDEDTFLDRTGELEEKRARRERRVQAAGGGVKAETFEGVCARLEATRADAVAARRQLERLCGAAQSVAPRASDGTADELDAFMDKIKRADDSASDTQAQRTQKSQLRLKLAQLQKDILRLEKMAKVAKPISLPALRKPQPLGVGGAEGGGAVKKSSVWVGSMKGHRLRKIAPTAENTLFSVDELVEKSLTGLAADSVVETEEETAEAAAQSPRKTAKAAEPSNSEPPAAKPTSPVTEPSSASKVYSVEPPPPPPTEAVAELDAPVDAEVMDEAAQPAKKSRKRVRTRRLDGSDYDASNPDYATWLPPDNQTGDGKTLLNAKFGY